MYACMMKREKIKLTSMRANKLGGGYRGRVVLPYADPKLLLLAL